MEMDLKKNRYNTFSELTEYCFRVASTVGLMSIEIFGYNNPKTKDFAVSSAINLHESNKNASPLFVRKRPGAILIPLMPLIVRSDCNVASDVSML